MSLSADDNSAETAGLVARVRGGDGSAVGPLLDRHRDRLRRMAALRLDRRLSGRVGPSDVVRDACAAAQAHLSEYLRAPAEPVFLWLRRQVAEVLAARHREYLGDTAAPELSLSRDPLPTATPAALAACLLGQEPAAARAGNAARRALRVQDGLNALDPLDRELLALRNFERLTREEAAHVLRVDEGTAARRYIRALKKLNDLLAAPDAN